MRALAALLLRRAAVAAVDLARRVDPQPRDLGIRSTVAVMLAADPWRPESPREQAARFRRAMERN